MEWDEMGEISGFGEPDFRVKVWLLSPATIHKMNGAIDLNPRYTIIRRFPGKMVLFQAI